MSIVKISKRFQVTIPKDVRQSIGLRPGMKVEIIPRGDHLTLIPLKPLWKLKGILKGIDTNIEREGHGR